MKIKFHEVKSMQECFNEALNHIRNCINNRSSGVANIKNPSGFRNRVTSYAVIYYLSSNWKKTDVIECEDRATHYGKPIGTVMERTVAIGDIKTSKYLELLKCARQISLNTEPQLFSI